MNHNAFGNFRDANHALQTGMLVGVLIKHGIRAWPMFDDQGDYTDEIVVEEEGQHWHIRVQPPLHSDPDETEDCDEP